MSDHPDQNFLNIKYFKSILRAQHPMKTFLHLRESKQECCGGHRYNGQKTVHISHRVSLTNSPLLTHSDSNVSRPMSGMSNHYKIQC